MGWFNKKEKEEPRKSLPDLPNLPETIPKKEDLPKEISQLPNFPNNSFNEKFSQNTIKDAVTGKKEIEHEGEHRAEERETTMPKPPQLGHVPEFPGEREKEMPAQKSTLSKPMKKEGPIFIRLDKFEESLNNFEEIKIQVDEIEKMLQETKELKEREHMELEAWEREIKAVKAKIEKINREVFSKVE